jgi:hypothetical protein
MDFLFGLSNQRRKGDEGGTINFGLPLSSLFLLLLLLGFVSQL